MISDGAVLGMSRISRIAFEKYKKKKKKKKEENPLATREMRLLPSKWLSKNLTKLENAKVFDESKTWNK